MCHDLAHISRIPLPEGVTTEHFTHESAHDFFIAYQGSFGDRPGFPDPSEDEWLQWLRSDPEFRPDDSRVAYSKGSAPIGFITVSGDWIEQVGVVPTWRGHRIGAHLVVRTLTALKASGSEKVWLNVAVDNESSELYRRLGFTVFGTRARYEDRTVDAPSRHNTPEVQLTRAPADSYRRRGRQCRPWSLPWRGIDVTFRYSSTWPTRHRKRHPYGP